MLNTRTARPGRLARWGALGAATVAGLLALAAPAGAAPTGTVDCTGTGAHPCYVDGGSFGTGTPTVTGLVPVTLGGATVLTYRATTDEVARSGSAEQHDWNAESGWPSAAIEQRRASINWILHNSYPTVSAAALDDHFGGLGTLRGITAGNAVAATQAAIWHFTGARDTATFRDAKARNLYQQLTIGTGRLDSAPDPAVSFDPAALSGTAGADAGPVTVHTDATSVTVATPAGVTLFDASGAPVTTIHDGQKLTVRLPAGAAGSGTLSASGSTADAHQGRILAAGDGQWLLGTGPDTATGAGTLGLTWSAATSASPSPSASTPASAGPSPSQSGSGAPSASTSASPSGTAGGGLPVTGTSLPLVGGVGAALLAAGAGVVLIVRRRRRT